jgi:hypothetical protein
MVPHQRRGGRAQQYGMRLAVALGQTQGTRPVEQQAGI